MPFGTTAASLARPPTDAKSSAGGLRRNNDPRRPGVGEGDDEPDLLSAEMRLAENVVQVPHQGPADDERRQGAEREGFLRAAIEPVVAAREAGDVADEAGHALEAGDRAGQRAVALDAGEVGYAARLLNRDAACAQAVAQRAVRE